MERSPAALLCYAAVLFFIFYLVLRCSHLFLCFERKLHALVLTSRVKLLPCLSTSFFRFVLRDAFCCRVPSDIAPNWHNFCERVAALPPPQRCSIICSYMLASRICFYIWCAGDARSQYNLVSESLHGRTSEADHAQGLMHFPQVRKQRRRQIPHKISITSISNSSIYFAIH